MVGRNRSFTLFAWGVLGWNILVVLWGAFVRATGSGAGCGSSWPLCDGVVVPRDAATATMIEFTHRATSGLALVAVAVLVVWSYRLFPRGHRARAAAVMAGVFILVEAALGAGLVVFGLVGDNTSPWRVVYLSAHLVNTLVLLGFLAATPWFAMQGARKRLPERPGAVVWALGAALAMSATGAVAALGDTLYPAVSMAAGIRDAGADSPLLLQLRLMHPASAVIGAAFIFLAAFRALRKAHLAFAAWAVLGLLGIQMAAGVVNVLLLAPVWMQIVHLFLADLLWIALVILYLEAAHEPAEATPGIPFAPRRETARL
jgi:heme a synthase